MITDDCRDTFNPASDPSLFRQALGRFTTGVTVVTACDAVGPVGMTANSFASVSLSPPLVLWSVAKSSQRHDIFVTCQTYMINVLSADQQWLCEHFARMGRDFSPIAHTVTGSGIPVLPGCAASFHCRLKAAHDAGDHTILLGEVTEARIGGRSALAFVNGRLQSLDGAGTV